MTKKSGLADSPFFQPPQRDVRIDSEPSQTPAAERKTERTEFRTEERTEMRTENRTAALPLRRSTRRYSYEFYDDQIAQLKRLQRDAEDRGERLTLSDIARDAFDQYLKDRTGSR